MAYTVTYDGDFLFDPYGDDVITDSSISGEVNAAVYFDFTIERNHRLYNKLEEKAGIVRVYSDSKLLFMGEITDIQEDFYGSKQVSCVDPRDHLNDVLLRPYSTVSGEQSITAPSSVDGYFQWLIDKYNEGMINPKFHFQVGVNQGAYLEKNNHIYRSSEQFPSVGSELEDKILDTLGGYLTLTYPDDIPTLNLYADVHEANTQMIDFGVNLIDFTKTTGTSDQYTAIRPQGGTPEKDSDDPDAPDPEPTTIESLGDGVTSVDSDYVKKGDVVYCQSAVNRYGYKEYSWNESDTTDPNDLLEKAVADLKKKVEPKLTLEVKAVDMALFMDGYDHLECGQVARVRSKPHGVDEYLLVSSMGIDLQDPSQTKYTLGQAYDSLTGEQSSFVKSLNAGINSSLDAVAGLDQTVKDQGVLIDQANNNAITAIEDAQEAQQKAEQAQQAADAANDLAQDSLDKAQQAHDLAEQIQSVVNEVTEDVTQIKGDMEQAEADLAATSQKADQALNKANELAGSIEEVTTEISGLNDDFAGLQVTVNGAVENANEALQQSSQTKTDLEGFKTSVSQTYTTKQELDDAIEQEVLDRNAAIEVGLDGISATVSSNYTELTSKVNDAQADADAALEAAQTASEDLTNFANEVSGDLNDLQSQIDGSIQTWFYSGVPTLANQPANQWTDSTTRNNHLGDLYYDTSTGYAYRFMLQNESYSWGKITDSDVTKALQDAAKAQDTADNKRRVFVTTPTPPYDVGDLWVQGSGGDIKRCQTAKTSSQSYAAVDWVLASKYTDDSALDDYKDVVATTYATKSSLTQTANEIRAEVSESYQVKGDYATSDDLDDAIAQEVLDRNSAISQSASQIQSTVSQTYTTKQEASEIEDTANSAITVANDAKDDLENYKTTVSETYATKSSVTQTAESIKSEVAATYTTKTEFQDTVDGLATTDYVQTTYATKSALEQTENSITASVESKYLSKTDASSTYATKTQLEQTEDSITTTVSQVQTIADNAFAKASQVEQTAEGLQVTLTETKATADDALNKADELSDKVVGDNLLLNTQLFEYSNNGYQNGALMSGAGLSPSNDYQSLRARGATGIPANQSSGTEICQYRVTGFSLGDEFTFSFYAKGTVNQFAAFFYGANGYVTAMPIANSDGVSGSGYGDGRSRFNCTSGWKRHWVTWRLSTSGNTSIEKYILIRTDPNTVTSANLYICGCKLEKGSVATQWTSSSRDAGEASRVATNYLKFDSSGLCVGNMTGTLGYNALITSNQYQIRNGSTVLSSFGASQITLGQNSASAKISFCDSQGSISYDANNRYLTLGASNTLRLSGGANALMYGRNVIVESTSGRLSLNSAQEVMANGYYVCNIVPLWGEGLSSGTITLSHGTEDYHAILIQTAYSDYVLAGSHFVAMPAGKTVDLSAISAGSGWASLFRMRVTISGNKITPQSNGSFNVMNNTWATGGANQLYIRYVLGFKRAI